MFYKVSVSLALWLGKKVIIKTYVVDCNIPLLLSKSLMKKAGKVVDLKKTC